MFWIGLTVFILLVSAGTAAIMAAINRRIRARNAGTYRGTEDLPDEELPSLAVAGVLGVIWLILTLFASIHQVPAGHVGIVREFGAIVGQTGDGLVFTAPWQSVDKANVRVQSRTFEGLGAASLETQDVYLTITVNYQVSPNAIQNLYRTVGSDYFSVLVIPRINQITKDETVQYPAIDVTRSRDEITAAVQARLGEQLSAYSVTIVNLTIDNIWYSDAFNSSIEEKQVATQNALRASEQVKQKEFEAAGVEAEALGRANSTRIEAQGQADANALLTASLTPALIQWQAVQRLSDNIQIALIPSGEGIIIDPATLLGGTP